jgi:CRISPR-associated RAMP protein (TIGR02581 family)
MYSLERRYLFEGRLTLTTALHVGGPGTLSPSDSPVVRTPDGLPFIPGSSFKGTLRSTVEKLAGSIPGLRTCALMEGAGCPGAQGAEQHEFDARRRAGRWTDSQLLEALDAALCDTCKLFGSHYQASRIICYDLYPLAGEDPVTQIRDGVGIDRDSECAVPQIKYDFEVVESGIDFGLRLQLENPTARDLGLTCAGFVEFTSGFAALGGLRSRGLGHCRLVDLKIAALDLSDAKTSMNHLRTYLVGLARQSATATMDRSAFMEAIPDTGAFLVQHIEGLFQEGSVSHA